MGTFGFRSNLDSWYWRWPEDAYLRGPRQFRNPVENSNLNDGLTMFNIDFFYGQTTIFHRKILEVPLTSSTAVCFLIRTSTTRRDTSWAPSSRHGHWFPTINHWYMNAPSHRHHHDFLVQSHWTLAIRVYFWCQVKKVGRSLLSAAWWRCWPPSFGAEVPKIQQDFLGAIWW